MDRVLGYEPRGRAFESLRARQLYKGRQSLALFHFCQISTKARRGRANHRESRPMAIVYSLTAAGQDALKSEVGEGDFPLEVNFPQDYKRILAMIEVGGHEDVLRGRLRRFPDQLINEWLKELEDLN